MKVDVQGAPGGPPLGFDTHPVDTTEATMQTFSRRLTLAALTLTALTLLGERPARAQNTYADFPFNQGSLFYRYSGARPPATTNSPSYGQRRGFFRRQGAYRYAAPTPAYRTVTPGYGTVYAPQPAAPTARYLYPPR